VHETSLNKLFNELSCDKGSEGIKGRPPHNYHLLYEKDMKPKKNDKVNILEIGILKGRSLEAFIKYFPNAEVYGIDTFSRIPPEKINILNHSRVHHILGDSMDKNISSYLKNRWSNIKFDFIIDDGYHSPDANRLTFLNFIEFLKEDGIYYVEDAWPIHLMSQLEIDKTTFIPPRSCFTKNKIRDFLEVIKPYNYTEHDFRNITDRLAPDSFIFRITK